MACWEPGLPIPHLLLTLCQKFNEIFCCCEHCFPSLNGNLKHFPLNSSAICFLLVPGRCLTSQKIKIETMKANHFNFLLSYLQVYLNLPFPFLPNRHKGESIPSPRLPPPGLTLQVTIVLRKQQPGRTQLTSSCSQQRLCLQHSTLFLSPCSIQTACCREHAAHNWGHVTVLCKTFFMA